MMMLKKRFIPYKFRIIIIGMALMLSGSCVGDFNGSLPEEYTWSPSLAFPIGWSEFGLNVGQGFDTLLNQVDTLGIPLWASLPSIPFSGNILFDFEEVLGQREEVQYVQLRVNTYNGFPVDITVQGYLLNAQGIVIDSLFSPILIMKRGELSGGGETVKHGETRRDLLFDGSRLDLLVDTKKIHFVGKINTVAYFPRFTFEVQLGAILGIETTIPVSGN